VVVREPPALVGQAPLRLEPLVEASAGVRSEDGIERHRELHLDPELDGAVEDLLVVGVEAEHEAAPGGDAVLVQHLHHFLVL
jgi:hypothetical protein